MEDVFVLNKEGKRMNRLVFSYMLNVLLMVLAGWAFIELYYFTIEVANFIQTKRIPFEVSVSLMPIGLLLIFGIVSTVLYKIQKKKYKSYHIGCFHYYFLKKTSGKRRLQKRLVVLHLCHYGTCCLVRLVLTLSQLLIYMFLHIRYILHLVFSLFK